MSDVFTVCSYQPVCQQTYWKKVIRFILTIDRTFLILSACSDKATWGLIIMPFIGRSNHLSKDLALFSDIQFSMIN